MTHRERRMIERTQQIAAGDPRALLLANTPPASRSEVAARYDHEREARELDSDREPTTEELEAVRMQWWRAEVASTLAEQGGYRDIASRYLSGALTSAGMERRIVEAELSTPMPTDAEIRREWHTLRAWRREYIRCRYGV